MTSSASWINLIERWFAELTRKQLQRGVHRSVEELEEAINEIIVAHNDIRSHLMDEIS